MHRHCRRPGNGGELRHYQSVSRSFLATHREGDLLGDPFLHLNQMITVTAGHFARSVLILTPRQEADWNRGWTSVFHPSDDALTELSVGQELPCGQKSR